MSPLLLDACTESQPRCIGYAGAVAEENKNKVKGFILSPHPNLLPEGEGTVNPYFSCS